MTIAPAPTVANRHYRGPVRDHGSGADRAAVAKFDGADGPVVAAGKLAGGGDGPWVTVVGEDRAGADEDAVADGHAVIHESPVLDLDPVAQPYPFVDEGVAADDAFGPKDRALAEHRPIPDARSRADNDVGLELCGRVNPRRGVDHEELLWRIGRGRRDPRDAAQPAPEYSNALAVTHAGRSTSLPPRTGRGRFSRVCDAPEARRRCLRRLRRRARRASRARSGPGRSPGGQPARKCRSASRT